LKPWNLHSTRAHPRRVIALLLILLAAAALTRVPDLHAQVDRLLLAASVIIEQHRVLGAVVFVVASALSAMLVFFSAVLLVPVGIETWGSLGCFLLLWLGWLLGGVLTYGIGRSLGRPVDPAGIPVRSGRLFLRPAALSTRQLLRGAGLRRAAVRARHGVSRHGLPRARLGSTTGRQRTRGAAAALAVARPRLDCGPR
jgi:hypothetical protein